ncbi:hypothetical protein AB0C21_13660 [Spirillospora sp. NPDC049024]
MTTATAFHRPLPATSTATVGTVSAAPPTTRTGTGSAPPCRPPICAPRTSAPGAVPIPSHAPAAARHVRPPPAPDVRGRAGADVTPGLP